MVETDVEELKKQLNEIKAKVAALENKELRLKQSIFCARLDPSDEFEDGRAVKITNCITAYASVVGLFDRLNGRIKPQVDGAYNISWKVHQRDDGEMRYFMAIKGLKGRILLGTTKNPGEACSGSMVMPLMTQHSVWIEADRVSGDAGIFPCNLMGSLLEMNNDYTLEEMNALHQKTFSPISQECCIL